MSTQSNLFESLIRAGLTEAQATTITTSVLSETEIAVESLREALREIGWEEGRIEHMLTTINCDVDAALDAVWPRP